MGGLSKENLNNITISTWQSIYDMEKEWFDQFEMVIVDEVHTAKSKSLISIMEKLEYCDYRFGFTGTLDGLEVNELVLTGLFGDIKRFVSTKELMDQGYLSSIKIQGLLMKYSKQTAENYIKDYHGEVDFLSTHELRNKFIANLALSLKGNTLILFNYIRQGEKLIELLNEYNKNPNVGIHYIDGSVKVDDREFIRKFVDDKKENNIIVASYGTFQAGINIVNLHNLIIGSPTKSIIRLMQSLGRGLRKRGDKTHLDVFDIGDDITNDTSNKNYTLEHFALRLLMYKKERFPFKIKILQLEK